VTTLLKLETLAATSLRLYTDTEDLSTGIPLSDLVSLASGCFVSNTITLG
jgi:hypothetical protein